jgi:hypothetical protein
MSSKKENLTTLIGTVFPSSERTIQVELDDTYAGAHRYEIRNCLGFNDGVTEYVESKQAIQFVKKEEDGSITPGLQSEQLVLMLIDRHQKLNNKYPSDYNQKMLTSLQMFLDACRERVEERINRGVMGELKK